MRDKKLQVFVSSTFTDLREERQAAVEAILSSGHIPAGMELFSAGDETQMTVIKRWIDESDVYLLILGGRYGSVDKKTGKSYTQLEYEYAIEKNKPLFTVVISEKGLDKKVEILKRDALEQENIKALKSFRQLVTGKMVKFWDDVKDIKIAIHETLSEFSYSKELVGWIRGDNTVNSNLLAEQIANLSKENTELRAKLLEVGQGNRILYSGLEYSVLKDMLAKEGYDGTSGFDNLLDFLMKRGDDYSRGVRRSGIDLKDVWKLCAYKIIESRFDSGYERFCFTEDGHKFYLRTLAEQEANNVVE